MYAYAAEDRLWWQEQLGTELAVGVFGENLTLRGVEVNEAVVGERWQVGTAELEVTQPRFPCWKLGMRMNDAGFIERFLAAGRAGTYLRVVREGELVAGDRVERLFRPAHSITVGLVARLNHADRATALRLLAAAEDGAGPSELQALLPDGDEVAI